MMNYDETHAHEVIEEENYFVSMTDLMVGLIFIFVILLMYFVVQISQTTDRLKEVEKELTSINRARTQILVDLEKSLKESGINVSIDIENGVLRLPEEILFRRGEAVLPEDRRPKLDTVADALVRILPQYADTQGAEDADAGDFAPHKIEAFLIEGHTDDTGDPISNWNLSAARAITTYNELTRRQPSLAALCATRRTGECVPIMSVSGYAFSRPVDGARILPGDSPDVVEQKRDQNRRIDLRILMKAPLAEDVRGTIEESLNAQP